MVNDGTPPSTNPQQAPGKRLLLEATLRLCSSSRSLGSIGLRELAREAGLNPNTFYRHFRDVDDLGLTLIHQMSTLLREPLRQLRAQAAQRAVTQTGQAAPMLLGIDMARSRRVCHETVRLFFNFVVLNPGAFIIGVRELHGASAVLREALRQVMDEFADDMAADIIAFKLLPDNLSAPAVRQISGLVSRSLFEQSLDYLGEPQRREAICALAEEQIVMLFTGAAVMRSMGQLQLAP